MYSCSTDRVIRPPGGASTIFDEADAAAAASTNGERNVVTPERHVNYKMRSNFELGDEQPAPPPVSALQQQQSGGRRRSKPSGEWAEIGMRCFRPKLHFCRVLHPLITWTLMYWRNDIYFHIPEIFGTLFNEERTLAISVNPLTGDLVGVFAERRSTSNGGSNEDLSSNCSVASMSTTSSINSSKESSPAPSTFSTPIKNRYARVGSAGA